MLSKTVRLWLWRLHTWTGLLGGLFLLIVCVSGSVAVFKPEIERALDWGGYDFNVVPNGEPISAERALAVVREAYPKRKINQLVLPALPGSINSNLGVYWARIGGNKEQRPLDVLVDPYQAKVVAESNLREGWGFWLRQLHLRLLYGQFWGRWVVGGLGVLLVFSTISGLVIYAKFNANSWKPMLRRGRGSRIFLADLHKVVGIGSVLFNLIFGVTGAVLGLETLYDRMTRPSTTAIASATTKPAAAAVSDHEGGEADAPAAASNTGSPSTTRPAGQPRRAPFKLTEGMVDAALAQVSTILPDHRPSALDIGGLANGTLRVRMEAPTSNLIKEGAGSIQFDLRSGEPRRIVDSRDVPASRRLYYSMEPLHFGRLWGSMTIKLIWGVMGLAGGLLSITGYVIYVMRWMKKRAARRALHAAAVKATAAGAAGVA